MARVMAARRKGFHVVYADTSYTPTARDLEFRFDLDLKSGA